MPKAHILTYRLIPLGPTGEAAKLLGRRAELNAVTKARKALELVMRKHAGTPWAERARRELNYFQGIQAQAYWDRIKDAKALPVGQL